MEIKTEIINGKRYVCIDDLEKLFVKGNENGYNRKLFLRILDDIKLNCCSQNKMAEELGLSSSYITKIYTEKTNPPAPDVLRKIAKASKEITTYKELMQVCGYLDGIEELK